MTWNLKNMGSPKSRVAFSLLLATLTVILFLPVTSHEFINFDDSIYITQNPHIQNGLTIESLLWAFTTTYANFWHPLTWLSHCLDVHLFGLDAGMHHLINLLLHSINSALLFLVLSIMTGTLWRSLLVAVLFAIHPLHVESVAWAAERKDTLSTLFWLLTMGAYIWYTKRPDWLRFLPVLLGFTLGMLAKPILVVLPFALLLLDFWPLNRFGGSPAMLTAPLVRKHLPALIAEKTPLLLIAVICSVVAYLAQQAGGAVGSLETYSLVTRIANALVAYVTYIYKMFIPTGLAAYYPYRLDIPIWKTLSSGLLLACLTFISLRMARRYPYLTIGWFWFVGTLLPVIGLVQLGSHAMADRYTYISFIGLFIIIAWSLAELAGRFASGARVCTTVAFVFLVLLSIRTIDQLGHWRNTPILFTHALSVTDNNVKAHNNLGTYFLDRHQPRQAALQFKAGLDINPDNALVNYNYGLAMMHLEEWQNALSAFGKALELNPGISPAHRDIASLFIKTGNTDEAIKHLEAAIDMNPENVELRNTLSNVFITSGQPQRALPHLLKATQQEPNSFLFYYNLGRALFDLKEFDQAVTQYSNALLYAPNNPSVHNNMGNALARLGFQDEARKHYAEVIRIQPNHVDAYYNMGVLLSRQGLKNEAIPFFRKALSLRPGDPKTLKQLSLSEQQ